MTVQHHDPKKLCTIHTTSKMRANLETWMSLIIFFSGRDVSEPTPMASEVRLLAFFDEMLQQMGSAAAAGKALKELSKAGAFPQLEVWTQTRFYSPKRLLSLFPIVGENLVLQQPFLFIGLPEC